jgi:hypothetical protein
MRQHVARMLLANNNYNTMNAVLCYACICEAWEFLLCQLLCIEIRETSGGIVTSNLLFIFYASIISCKNSMQWATTKPLLVIH